MSKAFADVAWYGYPDGVRPRSVLGRVVDALRALGQLLRGVAVMLAVLLAVLVAFLAPSALEAGMDAYFNTLPPCVEESAAVYDSGVTKGGAR